MNHTNHSVLPEGPYSEIGYFRVTTHFKDGTMREDWLIGLEAQRIFGEIQCKRSNVDRVLLYG